ncbi:hypothetical protein NB696_000823 [Xanthomonas sacchari]|nr:hypothetical protein [Xanthomonas sacchari]MCW0443951.1 hypothetical protein [Xanthomonas sacchari]
MRFPRASRHHVRTRYFWSQAIGIYKTYRRTMHIGIQVTTTRQPNRILPDESRPLRLVIPRPVIIQPIGIPLPPRVLVGIGEGRAALRGSAIRIVVVALHRRPGRVGQQPRAAQQIGQEVCAPAVVVAREALVDAGAGQDRVDRTPLRLLHRIQTVVEVLRGRVAFRLRNTSTQCVVAETGQYAVALLDLAQPVAVVPDVAARAIRQQVAVIVVARRDVAGLGLAVVVVERVVATGRRQRLRRMRAGLCDKLLDAGVAVFHALPSAA